MIKKAGYILEYFSFALEGTIQGIFYKFENKCEVFLWFCVLGW
jgi:hypothetical protein